MARFCTKPYEPPTAENMDMTFMHLTNYTLNKNSADFVHSSSKGAAAADGGKIDDAKSSPGFNTPTDDVADEYPDYIDDDSDAGSKR